MDVDAPRDFVFCRFCEREIPSYRWACSEMDEAARQNTFANTDDEICRDELARRGYDQGETPVPGNASKPSTAPDDFQT